MPQPDSFGRDSGTPSASAQPPAAGTGRRAKSGRRAREMPLSGESETHFNPISEDSPSDETQVMARTSPATAADLTEAFVPPGPQASDEVSVDATFAPSAGQSNEPTTKPAPAVAETEAQDSHGDVQDDEGKAPKSMTGKRMAIETGIILASALILSLLIKTFLLQPFYIPSESMYNTMLKDDKFMVSKLTPGVFDLKRGDIVVFEAPLDWQDSQNTVLPDQTPVAATLSFLGIVPQDMKNHWVKRVIGLPGDHVVCCTDGKLVINGVQITEPYLYPGSNNSKLPFDITVRPDHVWLEGDNRDRSEDSRYQMLVRNVDGQVPMSAMVGKAEFIYWPSARWTRLNDGESAFKGVPNK